MTICTDEMGTDSLDDRARPQAPNRVRLRRSAFDPMNAAVAYWVDAAREQHRWATDTRRKLRVCRRTGAASLRKNLRNELLKYRTRRTLLMVQARRAREEVARADAQRLAELARVPAGIVPGLTIGGRLVFATGVVAQL